MKILRSFVFRGPSLLARETVIRLNLDPEEEDILAKSESCAGIAGHLDALLPADASLWAADEDADAAICPAEIICRLALALQREFGFPVRRHGLSGPVSDGTVEVFYAYADWEQGLLAGHLAVTLVGTAMAPPVSASASDELPEIFDKAMEQLRQAALKPTTRRNIWEAERRGIPWQRLAHSEGMVRLGQGHLQQRCQGSYWQATPFLAMKLATAKAAAAEFLRDNGIPVPRNRLVTTVEAALTVAARIGYPVVVKPNERDMGTGVSINIRDDEALRQAFAFARRHGPVLIEQQLTGNDHRITVLHGRMIAAGSDIAAYVIGDGRSSVQQLIDAINRDPRRGERDYNPLKTIHPEPRILDRLARQGFDLQSIPPAGAKVALRLWWRQGGDHSALDVTALVHPENRAMFERAVRLVGLDVAGVDFITPDISQPWFEVGGAINEINPTPGLNTHVRAGAPDVHRIMIDAFFPPDNDGRIPVIALQAPASHAACGRLLAAVLRTDGHSVGLAAAEGAEIAGQRVRHARADNVAGAQIALGDPLVTAAVLEVSEQSVAAEGLGFDRSSVAVVMGKPENPAATALLLGTADDCVILNVDAPGVAELARDSRARRLCLISETAASSVLQNHLAAKGMAVAGDGVDGVAYLCLWEDGRQHPVLPAEEAKRLCRERGLADLPALMAVIAAAHAAGVSLAKIAGALRGSAGSPTASPSD